MTIRIRWDAQSGGWTWYVDDIDGNVVGRGKKPYDAVWLAVDAAKAKYPEATLAEVPV